MDRISASFINNNSLSNTCCISFYKPKYTKENLILTSSEEQLVAQQSWAETPLGEDGWEVLVPGEGETLGHPASTTQLSRRGHLAGVHRVRHYLKKQANVVHQKTNILQRNTNPLTDMVNFHHYYHYHHKNHHQHQHQYHHHHHHQHFYHHNHYHYNYHHYNHHHIYDKLTNFSIQLRQCCDKVCCEEWSHSRQRPQGSSKVWGRSWCQLEVVLY